MHETPADLAALQHVLDRTYGRAGAHLLEIHTDNARLSAEQVATRLQGMLVMVVATVSADGRPFTGPVDAFFYRGRICFGTSAEALRARHLDQRPAVSVSYVEGEALTVTVHGRARRMDLAGPDAGFEVVARAKYGETWDEWMDDAPYFVVEPDRMLAADMSVHTAADT